MVNMVETLWVQILSWSGPGDQSMTIVRIVKERMTIAAETGTLIETMIAGVLVLAQETRTGDIPVPDHVIVITTVTEAKVKTEIETDIKLSPYLWNFTLATVYPTIIVCQYY